MFFCLFNSGLICINVIAKSDYFFLFQRLTLHNLGLCCWAYRGLVQNYLFLYQNCNSV